jgi:hypothetical protein
MRRAISKLWGYDRKPYDDKVIVLDNTAAKNIARELFFYLGFILSLGISKTARNLDSAF